MSLFKKIVNYFKKPKLELTEWYPANTMPVRIGVYQVKVLEGGFGVYFYCHWDGKQWRYESYNLPLIIQDREWRGISK